MSTIWGSMVIVARGEGHMDKNIIFNLMETAVVGYGL